MQPEPWARIHPTARLGSQVTVGPGSVIEAWSVIGAQARIGPGAYIGPHARIGEGVQVGPGCRVDAGACIGGAGPTQGVRVPVVLGANCHVGEHALIEGGLEAPTVLEDEAFVMARCRVAPGAVLGRGSVVTNNSCIGSGARLDPRSVVGGFCYVAPGVHIGTRVMVGAFSRIGADVPPYALVDGDPPRLYDVNRVGLRRAGAGPAVREALHRAFRLLFRSPTPLPEVLAQLAGDAKRHAEVRELLEFAQRRPRSLEMWRQWGKGHE